MKKYKDALFVVSAGKGNENLDKMKIYPACFNLQNIIVVGGLGISGKQKMEGTSLAVAYVTQKIAREMLYSKKQKGT
ncbi:hypothetical protein SAMN02910358_01280 [Lachnospiraceae bacterium XBB1006]|nr:hypothetical protein SAMN02910358_01280 [Lachnospiraceae bacterium XBB1006]